MKTTYIVYCGRRLEVPCVNGEPLHLPFNSWNDWPESYCGAGKGFLEWIIPEKFPGGTVVTPCCYIHDVASKLAGENVEHQAIADRMFMRNMVEAIFMHHPLNVVGDKEHTDLLWAISYYSAVDKRNK